MHDVLNWLGEQLVRAEQAPPAAPASPSAEPMPARGWGRRLRRRPAIGAAEPVRRGPPAFRGLGAARLDAAARDRGGRRGRDRVHRGALVRRLAPGGCRCRGAQAGRRCARAARADPLRAGAEYGSEGAVRRSSEGSGRLPDVRRRAGRRETGISADPANDTLATARRVDQPRWQQLPHDLQQRRRERQRHPARASTRPTTRPTPRRRRSPDGRRGRDFGAPTSLVRPRRGPGAGTALSESGPQSYYEQLYQDVQAGDQATSRSGGDTSRTITSSLVGQTTLGGEPVDELRFDMTSDDPRVRANATRTSGARRVHRDDVHARREQIVLDLDSRLLPAGADRRHDGEHTDIQGTPPGTDRDEARRLFSDQSYPTRPPTRRCSTIGAHPGATLVPETYAQYRAEHGLAPLPGSAAATGPSGSTADTDTAGSSGATAPAGAPGSTGATGSS